VRRFGFHYLIASDSVKDQMNSLPRAAGDWKLGEPYSYLIDVLGSDGTPVFRIYYQDTANSAPLGFPPESLRKNIDLAILAVAKWKNVSPAAPDSLLLVLQPRNVIAAHWESFFDQWSKPTKRSPASDTCAFIKAVHAVKSKPAWWMPTRGETLSPFP